MTTHESEPIRRPRRRWISAEDFLRKMSERDDEYLSQFYTTISDSDTKHTGKIFEPQSTDFLDTTNSNNPPNPSRVPKKKK